MRGVALILTATSPVQNHVQRQQSMQKYCNTLKYMWKEFETKLLDNYRNILAARGTQFGRFKPVI